MSGGPTWGVAAQVKAERAALETFVAWHLELGAARVVIYFDDPDDPCAALLEGFGPRVAVVRCDAKHWAGFGKRPGKKTTRQTLNIQHAYDRTDLDWLAHVDVDEFILPVALQKKLAARGHDVGKIDGILGAATRNAVQREQVRLGLPADAWPTRALLGAL